MIVLLMRRLKYVSQCVDTSMVVLMHNSTSSVVNGFGSVLAPICASLVELVLLDKRDVGTRPSVSSAGQAWAAAFPTCSMKIHMTDEIPTPCRPGVGALPPQKSFFSPK